MPFLGVRRLTVALPAMTASASCEVEWKWWKGKIPSTPRAAPAVLGEQRPRRVGARSGSLNVVANEHGEAGMVGDPVAGRRVPGVELHGRPLPGQSCVEFLQWALPRLGLRWVGFRKVRRQVCRRLARRLDDLGLPDLTAYRDYLDAHPQEWAQLAGLTPITISRFYRDRSVFAGLENEVLPALVEGGDGLSAWSAGCASGEEAYTLALIADAIVLTTDVDPAMLRRARAATYGASSLKELPDAWRERGFERRGELYTLRPRYRRLVTVRRHDLGTDPPPGRFDLVLCRNVAFTYFAPERQRAVVERLTGALRPGGALVIGLHETSQSPHRGSNHGRASAPSSVTPTAGASSRARRRRWPGRARR
jgi:chemotaxis protein methyltransferase CheR